MTRSQRLRDLSLALLLAVLLAPVMLAVAALILLLDGRPVLFRSERMSRPDRAFMLVKFRTMRPGPRRRGVTGGDKSADVTGLGRVLRRTRLDELPQLWNVLRGDMGFVGPRPPLRTYVEAAPHLYAEVLKARPGITGMASLLYHRHEERLLAACATAEETHEVYLRRCVPRKARIDLAYAGGRSHCADMRVMLLTVWAVFGTGPAGRRHSPKKAKDTPRTGTDFIC